MNFLRLLRRNLLFFWPTHFAVIAGVMVATAVIGGALIVGDSVRDSLRDMSLARLGRIDHAVFGGRFFREDLAAEYARESQFVQAVAPALLMQAAAESRTAPGGQRARAGRIEVCGLDQRLWELLDTSDVAQPAPGEVVLSQTIADQLQLRVGDPLSLIIEIPAAIPRDALLGEREETVAELPVRVSAIAAESTGLSRFGLNPSQQLPANAFVDLHELQAAIGLQALPRSRRNPVARPARVNALFASIGADVDQPLSPSTARKLTLELGEQVRLDDLSLRIVDAAHDAALALESEQLYLDRMLAPAAEEAARELDGDTSPVLVYLVNEIAQAESPEKYSMYSVVAGLDPSEQPPFGPFTFRGEHEPLAVGQVWLNEWVAEDLDAKVGDVIRLKYYLVGDRGELPEVETPLRVAGIVELTGPADDRSYAPHVPGVTDAESYDDWRSPFPLQRRRITQRDEDYWDEYRTTPKLFVSLDQARALWRSRYGDVTSIRVATDASPAELRPRFIEQLQRRLDPQATGLMFQPVKQQGLDAAAGTTDFTGLFIGFSFFLIVAALLLVGLLFQLGLEQRRSEYGLLAAVGFSNGQQRRVMLLEGALVLALGGLLGALLSMGYAGLIMYGLRTWWNAAVGTQFLSLSLHPGSVFTGVGVATMAALLVIAVASRKLLRRPARELLSGSGTMTSAGRAPLARWLASIGLGGAALGALLGVAGLIPEAEAFAGFSYRIVAFFLVGTCALIGCLAGLAALLAGGGTLRVAADSPFPNARLALRNAGRNRGRSVATTSLIACATFIIVAVAAGQQNPLADRPRRASGDGGYLYVAESVTPILYDLNSDAGRAKLGFDPQNLEQKRLLETLRIDPLRVRPGEDASCLNLYQTRFPTILGVPPDVLQKFDRDERFRFADTPGPRPWALLEEAPADGTVPVIGDMNTLQYSLHKGLGATLQTPEDNAVQGTMRIRGQLANSIFQGVLLMSEENFLKLFPDQSGFRYFLIEQLSEELNDGAAVLLLEDRLHDYGFDAERTSQRLANFLAVQNTYLSTFQALGGLGLLLGACGLATVMLRNVLDRKREFSLLRAVGFSSGQVAKIVLAENSWLLGWGLLSGAGSAALAMAPHLSSAGGGAPWASLAGLLLAVVLAGTISGMIALRVALSAPLVTTLRGD